MEPTGKTTQTKASGRRWFAILGMMVTVAAAMAGIRYYLRYRHDKAPIPTGAPTDALTDAGPVAQPPLEAFTGLSEEEAASRLTIDPAAIREERHKAINHSIVRRNIFSIFNVTLLVLSLAMLLLGDPWSAFLTILVLLFNIGMKIFQQMFATRQIASLSENAQLSATVIRDGKSQRVDYLEVVQGDVVVFGPGDEFVSDGTLLTQSPIWATQSGTGSELDAVQLRRTGDAIRAGEQCAQGSGAYRSTEPASVLLETSGFQAVPQVPSDLTPLQRLMDKILRTLIVIVAIFFAFMLVDFIQLPLITPEIQSRYREMAAIIFSLAPSGLFFTVLATYAVGAAYLAQNGALVRETSLVEALAQTTVICFGKSGVLTNTRLNTEIIPTQNPEESLSPGRVLQLLGVFAHSVQSDSGLTKLIADSYNGQRYQPTEEVSWVEGGSWQGISLAEPEVRGTYVLGYESGLAVHLQSVQAEMGPEGDEEVEAVEEESGASWRHPLRSIRHRFSRGRSENENENDTLESGEAESAATIARQDASPQPDQDVAQTPKERGRFGRAWHSLSKQTRSLLPSGDKPNEEEYAEEAPAAPAPTGRERLVYAYLPEPQALHDEFDRPVLPTGLIPLTYLDVTEEAREGADKAIRAFKDAGVDVKIISAGSTADLLQLVHDLGLSKEDGGELNVVTGPQLSNLDRAQQTQAVASADIITSVTTEQHSDVITMLEADGEEVTMVGDSLSDVPAMEEASLSISLRTASQAAINTADIILQQDTLESLVDVLHIGQRVVNGLLNTLKLNLTQIGYVFLLLIAMIVTGSQAYYYSPSQGGVVIFFTVVVPSIALTLWAKPGAVVRSTIYPRLLHFVVPAAATVSACVLVVEWWMGTPNGLDYGRLIITTLLMMTGVLLVIFVQPAIELIAGDSPPTHDLRIVWLALGLFIGFLLLALVPLAQQWFGLGWLTSLQQYVMLGGVTLVWAVVLQVIWRIVPRVSELDVPDSSSSAPGVVQP